MYTDALLLLNAAAGQVVTATAVSTNSVDTATAFSSAFTQGRDLAEGTGIEAHINTTVSASAAGAATVTFEIVGATDAALTANLMVLGSTGPIAKADLVADAANTGLGNGQPIVVRLNPQLWRAAGAHTTPRRYIGVRYTIATGPLDNGSAFSATMVLTHSTVNRSAYVSGFTV